MTSVDINLLSTPKVDQGKVKKLKIVRRISVSMLLIVGILAILSFVLNISSQLNAIKKEQDNVISQITVQQQKAVKLQIVNERIKSITAIYAQRPDFAGVLSLVGPNLSTDISMSGIDLGQGAVTLTFSSSSLLSLNNFLNLVIDGSKKEKTIKSVFLDTLAINSTSSIYTMGIKFNLK